MAGTQKEREEIKNTFNSVSKIWDTLNSSSDEFNDTLKDFITDAFKKEYNYEAEPAIPALQTPKEKILALGKTICFETGLTYTIVKETHNNITTEVIHITAISEDFNDHINSNIIKKINWILYNIEQKNPLNKDNIKFLEDLYNEYG